MSRKFPYIAYFWNDIKRIDDCYTMSLGSVGRYANFLFHSNSTLNGSHHFQAFSLFCPHLQSHKICPLPTSTAGRASIETICLRIPASLLPNEANGWIFVHVQDVGSHTCTHRDGSVVDATDTIRHIKSKVNAKWK